MSITRKRFLEKTAHWTLGGGAMAAITALAACSEEPSQNTQDNSNVEKGPTEEKTMESKVAKPIIRRIKMATVGASDLTSFREWYPKWLNYELIEDSTVSPEMAASWGAPNSTGRPFVLLRPESSADVYIRAVEVDAVPGYKAMTTWGWNSIEIIVDDVYALFEKIKDGPFDIIGEPHSLGGGFASIHAMQVKGANEEILYLTCETGDRETSSLPLPGSFIDRVFIMILAGPNIKTTMNFYANTFNMGSLGPWDFKLGLAAKAQGLPEDHTFPLGLSVAGERGNNIEHDGYPVATTGPRPRAPGQLSPGIAMTTFSVETLDNLGVSFITDPITEYGGKRSAAFIGPAAELVELIEDPGS